MVLRPLFSYCSYANLESLMCYVQFNRKRKCNNVCINMVDEASNKRIDIDSGSVTPFCANDTPHSLCTLY